MRLLPDENLPKRLKDDFPNHEVYTVREREWNGIKNGQLLQLLLENNFDAFLTFDKNLAYQQNFPKELNCSFCFNRKKQYLSRTYQAVPKDS
jgi:hypothetical protein